jgi:hypothetical protein
MGEPFPSNAIILESCGIVLKDSTFCAAVKRTCASLVGLRAALCRLSQHPQQTRCPVSQASPVALTWLEPDGVQGVGQPIWSGEPRDRHRRVRGVVLVVRRPGRRWRLEVASHVVAEAAREIQHGARSELYRQKQAHETQIRYTFGTSSSCTD